MHRKLLTSALNLWQHNIIVHDNNMSSIICMCVCMIHTQSILNNIQNCAIIQPNFSSKLKGTHRDYRKSTGDKHSTCQLFPLHF